MENGMAALGIKDLEDEELEVMIGHEESGEKPQSYEFCLVGRFLTTSHVHFPAMKTTMANLWHPTGGLNIDEIGEKRVLFRFYYEVDVDRVFNGGPWTFNNHLLLVHRMKEGDDPVTVPIDKIEIWVQIHKLPSGFMSATLASQLGNFLGVFVDYDSKSIANGKTTYMRIRVSMNVNDPLRRKKKLNIGGGRIIYVEFQYERLTLFCFLCGRLGHSESFCPLRLVPGGGKNLSLEWDANLRVDRKKATPAESRWLRSTTGGVAFKPNPEIFGKFMAKPIVSETVENSNNEVGKGNACGDSSLIKNKVHVQNNSLVGLEKSGLNEVVMGYEEDEAMWLLDGKKRPRNQATKAANISSQSDLEAVEQSSLSARLGVQASRQQ